MKKRILFVEDNTLLLQMYQAMLEGDSQWEVATAENGFQALELMKLSAFDVVVSDMRMPRMNGLELMNEVRQHSPRSSRIVVSGLNDQEEVARSLDSTHQFLAKPFDVKALKSTLNRICGLDAYLKDEKIRTLVGHFSSLPSFPSLYVEVMKEISAEEPSLENIASVIARDPGMTAKMLQIVNSAAIGLSRKVGNPFEAVQFLGLGTVRSLVLSAHIFSCFEQTNLKGFSVTQLWDHGMKCGRIACMIMQYEQAEPGDVEDAYIAGMLHDIGKLMVADGLPDQFQQAIALAVERDIPLHEAELEVFGATHAGVAAYLLGLWGLPAAIVEAVAFHHTPAVSDLRVLGPLAAVHVANVLEHEISGHPLPGKAAELDINYLASVRCENRLNAWRQEAEML
ncbi:MAG: HDOD domain-containing protein, partial [Akkermansiaceae bacterium]|nr:HDOD domain-containing protein [Verrucomicrobiales bacterium]